MNTRYANDVGPRSAGLISALVLHAVTITAVMSHPPTRADGAIYYALADGKTRRALNVENFFDRKYFPTVDGDDNISPGAPRSIRVTLNTTF